MGQSLVYFIIVMTTNLLNNIPGQFTAVWTKNALHTALTVAWNVADCLVTSEAV